MAPLLREPLRTPLRFLLNHVHPDRHPDHQANHPALTHIYNFLCMVHGDPIEDEAPNPPIEFIDQPGLTTTIHQEYNPLSSLLTTLQQTTLTNTTDFETTTAVLSLLTTINHLQDTPPSSISSNPLLLHIYAEIFRLVDTYATLLVWDHQILLSEGTILVSRHTPDYRMDLGHLKREYQWHYGMCCTLVREFGELVDEDLRRPGWEFSGEESWVGIWTGVRRVKETLWDLEIVWD
ncbi:uncharacterized protein BO80DRAFT_481871 [Aspergillus ibericus CBS 121593]|uniref:Uncharacterized protein n=1 Tax=Aspergillus ibericus CBS 121593 TaxID=1448316 RepID=A0A395GQB9_9EURO|nr:hypothetical protein BO80DRAFT_481871 [Aspergillus ibericus CBS 121593]RAK97556.1 hypothetical protein BO80DRAFT_481871 [Aspergillus ibericus CBS 121593]